MLPPQDITTSCVAPVSGQLAPLCGSAAITGDHSFSLAFVGLVDLGVFSGESGHGKAKSDPSEVSELSSAFSSEADRKNTVEVKKH